MTLRFSRFSRFLPVLGVWCGLFIGSARVGAQPLETPPHLATARCGMPAVVVGTDIYVIGGGGPLGFLSDLERIDTRAKPLTVAVVPTTLLPRIFHTAQASGPFLYVFGGLSPNGQIHFSTRVERLDTRDNSVKLMAPLPRGIRTPTSAIVGEKIYVAGGSNEAGERLDTLLIYDIPSNTWTEGASMPEKKECDLLPWRGGLLALGGFDGTAETSGVQNYDIATNSWRVLPGLPLATSAHHGAVIRDADGRENVVLFGDYVEMDRVQSGDPQIGNWQRISDSGFQRRRHGAVVAVGDQVYVIGGNVASSGSFLDTIQVFDAKLLLPKP